MLDGITTRKSSTKVKHIVFPILPLINGNLSDDLEINNKQGTIENLVSTQVICNITSNDNINKKKESGNIKNNIETRSNLIVKNYIPIHSPLAYKRSQINNNTVYYDLTKNIHIWT